MSDSDTMTDTPPHASVRWIVLVTLAIFGVYLAWITPMAISLTLRVDALEPGNSQYLGVILGVGSCFALLFSPLGGQLSDRTRTRFGRRRPWMIGGTVVGVLGCLVMSLAPTVWFLGLGWVIAQVGFSQVAAAITTLQADRLPPDQRGKVAGITGFATMVAPVLGAFIGGVLASDPLPLFLLPASIAVLFVVVFVLMESEPDSRGLRFDTQLTIRTILTKYVFNPRRYPDFGWNWIGRFLFFFGLTLNTTYSAFYYSIRLDIPVAEIGPIVSIAGMVGVIGTIIGALGSGFLSDRLQIRKPFVIGSGILFAVGSLIILVATNLPTLVLGAFLGNLAIGIFSAVDQALFLDILPEKTTDAGRFVNLMGLANTSAQSIAPIAASGFLLIGVSGGDRNYAVVYLAAALFALIGGLTFTAIKSVR